MRKNKLSKKEKEQLLQETYDKEMFLIPTKMELKKMSINDIAKCLSAFEVNSPAYIVVSHELNIRIITKQSKPQYITVAVTLLCVILGWFLSQWHPLETQTAKKEVAHKIQASTNLNTTNKNKDHIQQGLQLGEPSK